MRASDDAGEGRDEGPANVTELRLARSAPEARAADPRAPGAGPGDGSADGYSLAMECAARKSYRVSFCDALLSAESTALEAALGDRRALLVTTPTVNRLYGAALRARLARTNTAATLVLEVTEETKSLDLVQAVCEAALAHGLNRRGLLVGVGGGVCLDVVTLAASMIRRGIGHLRLPTTLIGQIDAGIGLKGAVNFCGKKSFLGCFHPPEDVLIDPAFLQSVPRRFLVAGLAEAIKMGIVRDPLLFELLERSGPALVQSGFAGPELAAQGRELLRRSIGSMLDELRKNPYEDQGYERLVDFGHTFSPGLESALGFELQHGEAVAIDLALSATVAQLLGLCSRGDCERIVRVLKNAGLPVHSPRLDAALCREGLLEATRHRGGSCNLVVPAGVGSAVFVKRHEELPDSLLEAALSSLAAAAAREAA